MAAAPPGGSGQDLISMANAIRKAVGFRNIPVHEYVEVNAAIVVGRLGDLTDLEEFVRAVAAYISSGR
jgi:uncharacterized protein YutE (UPF0331/DUF86 family)